MPMPTGMLRLAAVTTLAFASGAAPVAFAQVYKCTDEAGKTTYTDVPCARGSRPLAVPDSAKGPPAGPVVCGQLQDEISRLQSAAERSGTSLSTRGKALQREYAARCVGIARSQPAPQ
jgi:Domain of unknown function (DUF4124)